MTALAIAPHWRVNPALADPAQALWSELRFARGPLDLFTMLLAAIRHCDGTGARRGDTYRTMERHLGAWRDAGVVSVSGEPPAYRLERKYLSMASPPALPAPSRPSPFPKRTQRQRLWSAMKVLRCFDLPTLLMTAEAGRPAAMDMIRVLKRAGWLRETRTGWTTAAARPWGAVAPTWSHKIAADGPFIRVTEPATGAVIDLPIRPKALRDRRRESSANGFVDGGVG